ncbi:hypothetical protein FG670_06630 [Salmonella enterica subsp. enterica serovar Senftenberg]|uniref:hypothetical protein n=1 Tax=Salmonella TaxID=590 RepID=UPI000FB0161B|nr:hypothetical protein [Salmonella enterica]EDC1111261.1 hypothetical protein [Salmonella enterica subsp. enterica serovar Senftenberg]EDC1124823.1 hypothetical protein [Salmonella enterica subsp. enterica serovar Senftenberg]EDC1132082.1 hypothetical protein [Salmonella enterica subsp. enterica serovar Senftenberg]EDC1137384.1 hypothetical protein [Salmonella enterica subsp. enterica serovar Senftenberg]EDC1146098.1 hypothetical protein [Salmonella enterica subsp. enterica serovar Senftenber
MMEIKDRVALSARPGKLTLIREGVFLKCYQQSLFSGGRVNALTGTLTFSGRSYVFNPEGSTLMPRLKKMNILLILLLYSMAASASSNHPYSTDNKEYLYLPKDKPTLSWEKKEPQTDKNLYCLTPSDPGCSDMWYKEKLREHQERVQCYQLPKKRNFHK